MDQPHPKVDRHASSCGTDGIADCDDSETQIIVKRRLGPTANADWDRQQTQILQQPLLSDQDMHHNIRSMDQPYRKVDRHSSSCGTVGNADSDDSETQIIVTANADWDRQQTQIAQQPLLSNTKIHTTISDQWISRIQRWIGMHRAVGRMESQTVKRRLGPTANADWDRQQNADTSTTLLSDHDVNLQHYIRSMDPTYRKRVGMHREVGEDQQSANVKRRLGPTANADWDRKRRWPSASGAQ